jgi:tetratricopeptide (TPR) repeat protein
VKSFAYDIEEDEFLTLDDMMDIIDNLLDNKSEEFALTDLEYGEFHYLLGVLNYEKGDIDTAESYLYKSMQIFSFDENMDNVILCLIGVYLRQGRFQKSSTAHKKLLELSKKEMQGKEGDRSFSGGINSVKNFLPIEAEINQFESTITLDVDSYLRQMTNATDVFANK